MNMKTRRFAVAVIMFTFVVIPQDSFAGPITIRIAGFVNQTNSLMDTWQRNAEIADGLTAASQDALDAKRFSAITTLGVQSSAWLTYASRDTAIWQNLEASYTSECLPILSDPSTDADIVDARVACMEFRDALNAARNIRTAAQDAHNAFLSLFSGLSSLAATTLARIAGLVAASDNLASSWTTDLEAADSLIADLDEAITGNVFNSITNLTLRSTTLNTKNLASANSLQQLLVNENVECAFIKSDVSNAGSMPQKDACAELLNSVGSVQRLKSLSLQSRTNYESRLAQLNSAKLASDANAAAAAANAAAAAANAATAAANAAAAKAAADAKTAQEKSAAELKAIQDKAAADAAANAATAAANAAAAKAAADAKIAQEKSAADAKTAQERVTAEKEAADRLAAEKLIADAKAEAAKIISDAKSEAAKLSATPTPTPKASSKTTTSATPRTGIVGKITPKPTPTIKTSMKPSASPTPAKSVPPKKITITCIKGKLIKKVTAIKPRCPTGYKKKIS
jgi:hypothetical protein